VRSYQQTTIAATATNTTDVSITVMVSNTLRPSSDWVEHLNEVSVRIDTAAGIAASALLREVDSDSALEAVLGMLENCRLHLKAVAA